MGSAVVRVAVQRERERERERERRLASLEAIALLRYSFSLTGFHIFGFCFSRYFLNRVARFHSVGFGQDITNLRGMYEET